MGPSNNSFSSFKQLTKDFPLEHRPRMLKDFLFDHDSISCSSSIPTLIQHDLNAEKRLKSRSTALSAFQAMINKAVKNIHFAAIKSPPLLPRSLSRRLSRSRRSSCRESETENKQTQTKITVTIKDIIRWKSFRDTVEEESQPSALSCSPHHCTTATTTTTTPSSSSSSSNGSSWCESDFTSEYGHFEETCGEKEYGVMGKEYPQRVGEEDDSILGQTRSETNKAVGLKAEEKQQNNPVSVIGVQSDEDEEEEEEEKVWQLLNVVKETKSVGDYRVLVDFFLYELERKGSQRINNGFDCEMLSRGRAWINGEGGLWMDWDKKESCVREMEREVKWSKLKEEEEEVALAIENGMLDELLLDLFS